MHYAYNVADDSSTCAQLSILAFEITRHYACQPQVKAPPGLIYMLCTAMHMFGCRLLTPAVPAVLGQSLNQLY